VHPLSSFVGSGSTMLGLLALESSLVAGRGAPSPALRGVGSRAATVTMQGGRRNYPPIDEARRSRSPGLRNNFYDMPRDEFRRPFPGDARGVVTPTRDSFGEQLARRDGSYGLDYYGGDRGPGGPGPGGDGFDDRRFDERRFGGERRGPYDDRGGPYGPQEYGRGNVFENFLDGLRGYDDRRYGPQRFDGRGFDGGPYGYDPYDRYAFSGAAKGPWFDAAFGFILFSFLNSAYTALLASAFKTAAAKAAGGQLLSIATFCAIQEVAFLPTREWLRLDAPDRYYYPVRPLFANPLIGITFAFLFAVPLTCIANAAGVSWLPPKAPFPGADGVFLNLLAAPLAEEVFFRGWLLTAFTAAGGSQAAALVASSILFGFYHVPIAEITGDGMSLFAAYTALGAYLGYLYQRSGSSLPLVFITHGTLRLIELGGGKVLPF